MTSDTPGLPLADCIRNLYRKYRREGGVGNEKERKRVQEINQDILQNQNVCKKLNILQKVQEGGGVGNENRTKSVCKKLNRKTRKKTAVAIAYHTSSI